MLKLSFLIYCIIAYGLNFPGLTQRVLLEAVLDGEEKFAQLGLSSVVVPLVYGALVHTGLLLIVIVIRLQK